MAKIDYEKKHGVAVTPEAVQNADGGVTITLRDASGNVLDTYTLDCKTGIGKDAQGAEVNLPQTGNNSIGSLAAVSGAALTALTGALLVYRAFRKKRED
jgi:LPXTG-motif cell wall-anchored protein